ncbi:hypothetical protein ROHU_028316 [Labeo rohita]|uniref:Uncharacterized protein n=1 Tax=Labeo rohita TaxID=84645 RepID=A0A498M6X4_LABRO|nr:hypothetical protein ROHU_028316 [Labeo rohita]
MVPDKAFALGSPYRLACAPRRTRPLAAAAAAGRGPSSGAQCAPIGQRAWPVSVVEVFAKRPKPKSTNLRVRRNLDGP